MGTASKVKHAAVHAALIKAGYQHSRKFPAGKGMPFDTTHVYTKMTGPYSYHRVGIDAKGPHVYNINHRTHTDHS